MAFSTLIPALLLSLVLILGIFLCFILDHGLFDLALMMTKIDFFTLAAAMARCH